MISSVSSDAQIMKGTGNSGSFGTGILLKTNCYRLKQSNRISIEQYRIEIKHPLRQLTRKELGVAFWNTVSQNSQVFSKPHEIAFNPAHTIFSKSMLQFPSDSMVYSYQSSVLLPEMEKPTHLNYTIAYCGPVLLDFDPVPDDFEKDQDSLHVANVILKQGAKIPVVTSPNEFQFIIESNKSFFVQPNIDKKLTSNKCVELWKGFNLKTIHANNWKPIVVVNSKKAIFHKKASVLQKVEEILECSLQGDHELSTDQIKRVSDHLVGLQIQTVKYNGSGRIQEIIALGESTETTQFYYKNEKVDMTVADYYKRVKSVELKFPKLPCLVVGRKNKNNFVPMELCNIVFQKCENIINQKMLPSCNNNNNNNNNTMNEIHETMDNNGLKNSEYLARFGLEIEKQPIAVLGRLLPPPKISYNEKEITIDDGKWNSHTEKAFRGSVCRSWSLILLTPDLDATILQTFSKVFTSSCNDFGIMIPLIPDCVLHLDADNINFGDNLKKSFDSCNQKAKEKGQKTDLIVVVLAKKGTAAYTKVKFDAEVKHGILTQCITSTVVEEARLGTMHQIALKINAKLGGINHRVCFDKNYNVTQPTLVVGIDASYGSVKDSKPTIIGVVANIDIAMSCYKAELDQQMMPGYAAERLDKSILSRLKAFYTKTGVKPHKIIVYRDGVPNSQFDKVHEKEVHLIQKACTEIEDGYHPKITYIFMEKGNGVQFACESTGKQYVGMVVDSVVTQPGALDFYLNTHSARQHNSQPIHYLIRHDDNEFALDQIIKFTYFLTHINVRSNQTISLPGPVFYADLVCARCRCYMEELGRQHSRRHSSLSSDWSDLDDVEAERANKFAIQEIEIEQSLKSKMFYA